MKVNNFTIQDIKILFFQTPYQKKTHTILNCFPNHTSIHSLHSKNTLEKIHKNLLESI